MDGWVDGEENKNILVNNLKFMFNLRGKRKPCVCSEWIVVDLCRARQRSDKEMCVQVKARTFIILICKLGKSNTAQLCSLADPALQVQCILRVRNCAKLIYTK